MDLLRQFLSLLPYNKIRGLLLKKLRAPAGIRTRDLRVSTPGGGENVKIFPLKVMSLIIIVRKRGLIEYYIVFGIAALLVLIGASLFLARNVKQTSQIVENLNSTQFQSLDYLVKEKLTNFDVCSGQLSDIYSAALNYRSYSATLEQCFNCKDIKKCLSAVNAARRVCLTQFRALGNYTKLACYYLFDCTPLQAFYDWFEEDKAFATFLKHNYLAVSSITQNMNKSFCYYLFSNSNIVVVPFMGKKYAEQAIRDLHLYGGVYYISVSSNLLPKTLLNKKVIFDVYNFRGQRIISAAGAKDGSLTFATIFSTNSMLNALESGGVYLVPNKAGSSVYTYPIDLSSGGKITLLDYFPNSYYLFHFYATSDNNVVTINVYLPNSIHFPSSRKIELIFAINLPSIIVDELRGKTPNEVYYINRNREKKEVSSAEAVLEKNNLFVKLPCMNLEEIETMMELLITFDNTVTMSSSINIAGYSPLYSNTIFTVYYKQCS